MSKSTPDHTRMVSTLYKRLEKEGFKGILANHLRGVSRPEVIGKDETFAGYVPDAYAKQAKTPHIFEVETAASLGDEKTLPQWKLISAHVQKIEGRFIVVVPAGSKKRAEDLLKQHGILYADVWFAE